MTPSPSPSPSRCLYAQVSLVNSLLPLCSSAQNLHTSVSGPLLICLALPLWSLLRYRLSSCCDWPSRGRPLRTPSVFPFRPLRVCGLMLCVRGMIGLSGVMCSESTQTLGLRLRFPPIKIPPWSRAPGALAGWQCHRRRRRLLLSPRRKTSVCRHGATFLPNIFPGLLLI